MLRRDPLTAVQQLRNALTARVHHAVVAHAPGASGTLRIEGPGALSGVAQELLVGLERALWRDGFRVIECLGVDPDDPRGRPGRRRALVPAQGEPWVWEHTSGEQLQARVASGDEGAPVHRVVEPARGATVLPLRRRK